MIARVLVRHVDFVFPVVYQPFSVGFLNLMVLFQLGVAVDCSFLVDCPDDVSIIVQAPARHIDLNVSFALD